VNVDELTPAQRPSFYFVGVTTGKSSIMRVFPRWAEHLWLGDVEIRGIDCKWHDDPEVYRRVVAFLKADPLSLGGLVTTHKMDLLEAARGQFEVLDPYAELLAEISSISKQDGRLCGHAKDAITSGLSLEAFVPAGYWRRTGAELCLLGAGGSSLALTCYLMKQKAPEEWPARIVVTNRSPRRLEHMREVHRRINPGIPVDYVLAETAAGNDRVVNALLPGSLVVNATGLGKDAPGSPLTDAVRFPEGGLVWEYNYRGELVFLDQARAQQQARGLRVEDGWVYFIHGWTRVIAEVFHRDIPTSGPAFDELCRIAAAAR
jgi:shikimate 5-dehydrogenase